MMHSYDTVQSTIAGIPKTGMVFSNILSIPADSTTPEQEIS